MVTLAVLLFGAIALAGALFLARSRIAHILGTCMTGRGAQTSFRRPSSEPRWHINVVDESGNAVTNAEAMCKSVEREFWSTEIVPVSTDGHLAYVERFRFEPPDVYDVVVRAPGFAPTAAQMKTGVLDPVTVVLERGHEVFIRLQAESGEPIPAELRPAIYYDGYDKLSWALAMGHDYREKGSRTDPTMSFAEPVGDGRFRFALGKLSTNLFVRIDEPGFLRQFVAGPFANEPGAEYTVTIPRPARLDVSIEFAREARKTTGLSGVEVSISRIYTNAGRPSGQTTLSRYIDNVSNTLEFSEFLAAGPYDVHIWPVQQSSGEKTRSLARFVGQSALTLNAGETNHLALRYELVDESTIRGSCSATLTVVDQQGHPVTGRKYKVTYHDDDVDGYPVTDGVIPEDGVIRLSNLANKDKSETYYVTVDDEMAGYFYFKDDGQQLARTIRVPPREGDTAPVVTLEDVATGEAVDTGSLTGRVIYLDFWATWCGPCQDPMNKLNKLAAKSPPEWKDRVILAGVSIDDDRAKLVDHLDRKGWHQARQLWTPGGGEFRAAAAKAFGINGVPTAILIDQKGQIIWRGHPSQGEDDLVARIDALLR